MRTFLIIQILVLSLHSNASITYLKHDANGKNDGSSWTNAYTDFATAYENVGDTLWIAAGKYLVNTSSGDPIELKNSIVLGGFVGNEKKLSDKPQIVPTTILSGNIGDTTDFRDNFTGPFLGKGISLYVIFENIHFEDFNGRRGSVLNYGILRMQTRFGFVRFAHCTFMRNGNYLRTFAGNFYCLEGTIRLDNCHFEQNNCSNAYATLKGEIKISNCTFFKNSALYGSAFSAYDGGFIEVKNSLFLSNSSTAASVGHLYNEGRLYAEHCLFYHNTSKARAAGISTQDDTEVLISNCAFYKNSGDSTYPVARQQIDTLYGNINPKTPDTSSLIANYIQGFSNGVPLFFDSLGADGIQGTLDDVLVPIPGSALIDSGVALGSNFYDIRGEFRTGMPDIGCFEFIPSKDCVPDNADDLFVCEYALDEVWAPKSNVKHQLLWYASDSSKSAIDTGSINLGNLIHDTLLYFTIKDTQHNCLSKIRRPLLITRVNRPQGSYRVRRNCKNHIVEFAGSKTDSSHELIWTINGAIIESDTVRFDLRVIPIDSFEMRLIIVDSHACSNGFKENIYVYPEPDAGFSYNIIGSRKFEFVADSQAYETYAWDFGDSTFGSAATAIHTYSGNDTRLIKLEVRDERECVGMDSLLLEEVSLHQKETGEEIVVEQFGGVLRISAAQVRSVSLYDLQGKLLYEVHSQHTDQESILSLNYASIGKPRMVVLRVQTETQHLSRKLFLR